MDGDETHKPKGRGGRRTGAGNKKGSKWKTPASLVKALVPDTVEILPPKGADDKPVLKAGYIDPIEFCLALVNNDKVLLKRLGVETAGKKAVSLGQRIEAARIAAPFTNRKLPTELHVKDNRGFAERVLAADARVTSMRQPYEPPDGDDDGQRGAGAVH